MTGWREDALRFLLGPALAQTFFTETYERAPLVVAHGDPARFAPLLSIEAIDRLIAGADLQAGRLDLANAAKPVAREAYVSPSGLIDRGVIARQFQTGATIILQQLQEIDAALGSFCRALETVFSAHVQTNVYLTPPNAQGFQTHYDNHDVFVLQVSGEKRWRLYETAVDTPYRGEKFRIGAHEPGPPRQEFVLRAGDCAYLPRGLMHDAISAGDAPSLHITVGLIVKTYADLMLEAISEVALAHPGFRRSLPPGYARPDFDRTAARVHVRALAAVLGERIGLDAALDLMVDDFIRSRTPDNSAAIADAARAIAASDRFALRPHTPWRLADDEGKRLVLIAPGGDIDFKPEEGDAVERALSGAAFSNADVDEDIIRKLQAFGLIARL